MGLIVGITYFFFVIIGDTLRAKPQFIRNFSSGFRTYFFSCWERSCFAVWLGSNALLG